MILSAWTYLSDGQQRRNWESGDWSCQSPDPSRGTGAPVPQALRGASVSVGSSFSVWCGKSLALIVTDAIVQKGGNAGCLPVHQKSESFEHRLPKWTRPGSE